MGQGQLPAARAIGELMKRYSFASGPTNIQQLEASKIELRQGEFNDTGIESLSIYSDGVIITSKSSTEVLDAFLVDAFEWLDSAFGLKLVESHTINRAYESNVLVHSDAKLLKALEAYTAVQELLTKHVKAAMGLDVSFAPAGLSFAADHSLIAGMKPEAFRLERKVGLAFDTNYYVSRAPTRTPDHLSILETLEKLVS